MGNNRTTAANSAAKTATSNAGQYGAQAAGINSTIMPTLTREAQGGGGYTPTQANNQLVAGEQGAGGANAGITGTANLQAARTHNTGALSGVLDQAARLKQQTLSNNALGVQTRSADLANQQQAGALKQLGGLYGTDVNAQLGNQRLVPEDINAATTAGTQSFGGQFLQKFGGALGQGSGSGGALAGGG
jgi:hypothetical protein